MDSGFEDFDIMLFNPLVKEFTGNLNIEGIVFQLDRNDRTKPSFESLRVNIILNETQAFSPNRFSSLLHSFRLNSCF